MSLGKGSAKARGPRSGFISRLFSGSPHRRFVRDAMRCSGVAKERHETKVHVLLDMAVKKREARLVGDQIHGGASKRGNDHRILLDAGSGLAVELDKLEQVPVDVQGV